MKLLAVTAALAGIAAAAPTELETRQLFGNTYNEASGPCKPVTVFFARGTTETGNIGSIAGPPFLDALRSRPYNLDIARQGVNNYPADVAGFLAGGSSTGIAWLASNIDSVAQRCPNTKIVVSGYSQGAQVARKGLARASQKARVPAVVLFGDPLRGDGISGVPSAAIKTICAIGDLICTGASIILPAHLGYGSDAGEAARFVAGRL